MGAGLGTDALYFEGVSMDPKKAAPEKSAASCVGCTVDDLRPEARAAATYAAGEARRGFVDAALAPASATRR